MPFGVVISLCLHGALIGWAVFAMRSVSKLPSEDTPIISAELVTPSEFLRLKQGAENAKVLVSKAKEEPTPDESKNDTKRPDNAPPPAPAAPPPEPEPEPESEPEPEPEPAPPPGPSPEEKKLLEQKIEDERKAAEAKAAEEKRQAEEARKRAEEKKKAEAKKKADEEKRKKAAAEKRRKEKERQRKLAAEKKRKEEAKKKLDVNKLAALLDKLPDDGQPKALIDKDPRKKGQQASGSSQTATALGREAGTATGTDSVLSAREQDLLKGMIRSQLQNCWRLPGAGGGVEAAVVTLRWKLRPNGALDGEPVVTEAPSDSSGKIASEAALRAVRACQPYRLPPDSYDAWRDIIWVFDPRQML